jgi:hypothetical protein
VYYLGFGNAFTTLVGGFALDYEQSYKFQKILKGNFLKYPYTIRGGELNNGVGKLRLI